MTGDCDPVGIVEICQRFNVARSTVNKWRERDTSFPSPTWTVGGRPAWEWETCLTWYEDRNQI